MAETQKERHQSMNRKIYGQTPEDVQTSNNNIIVLGLAILQYYLCVSRWHWTYDHIQIVLNSAQKADKGIPVQSQ